MSFFVCVCTYLLMWLLLPSHSYALILSEIYPAASEGETEWIEVYNDQSTPMNVSDIFIDDKTGKKLLFQETTINALSYAIATSNGVLNNTGDTVNLKEASGTLIETIDYPDGAGTGTSYQRCPDGSWKLAPHTKMQDNSTPCQSNQTSDQNHSEGETFDSLSITEIHPNPSEGSEWVELFNSGDTSRSLTDWHLDDEKDAGSSPISFSVTVAAHSFAVVTLPSTMLNNSGDAVRILQPDQTEVAALSYPEIGKGFSYGKMNHEANDFCIQSISLSSLSSSCSSIGTTEEEKKTTKSTTTPTSKVATPKPKKTPTPTKKSAVLGASTRPSPTKTQVRRDPNVIAALQYTNEDDTSDPNPHKKSAFVALLSLSSAVGAGLLTIKKMQQ